MSVVHRMTGYDKRTELLCLAHDIPAELLELVRDMVQLPASDRDMIGSYPIGAFQAGKLAAALGREIDVDRYDWFIEPFRVQDIVAAPARA